MGTPDRLGHTPQAPVAGALLVVAPERADLLDRPLDYFLADNYRRRALCAALRAVLAAKAMSRADALRLADFLARDVELRSRDEEEDLFPALRRRAKRGDDLEPLLQRLADEGAPPARLRKALERALAEPGDALRLRKPLADEIRAFVDRELRRVAIENGIVLAIAGLRLQPADLAAIGAGMKGRRGGGKPSV